MKRLIGGIVMILFVLPGFVNAISQGSVGTIVFILMLITGGGAMVYFGSKHIRRRKAVLEIALQMLRTEQKINVEALKMQTGLGELEVRQHISDAQYKGLIPAGWQENTTTELAFNCPHCNQSLEAPVETLGQALNCPSCNVCIQVPNSQQTSTVPAMGLTMCPKCKKNTSYINNCCMICGNVQASKKKIQFVGCLWLIVIFAFLSIIGSLFAPSKTNSSDTQEKKPTDTPPQKLQTPDKARKDRISPVTDTTKANVISTPQAISLDPPITPVIRKKKTYAGVNAQSGSKWGELNMKPYKYLGLKDYDRAEAAAKEALELAEGISPVMEGSSLSTIIGVYGMQGKYAQAVEYCKRAV
jgi:hypothetical protein